MPLDGQTFLLPDLATREKLLRAADLLSKPGMWGQASPGQVFGLRCAWTALGGTYDEDLLAGKLLCRYLNLPQRIEAIWKWNDTPGRTQAEVVSALRKAAEI